MEATVPTSSFWVRMAASKALDKGLKQAIVKGNRYIDRLSKATHKADLPKLVGRERLNKGQSSFAFIGVIKDHYPKKFVVKRETIKRTKSLNNVGVRKEERLVTIADRTRLTIGLKSGNLPKWFR